MILDSQPTRDPSISPMNEEVTGLLSIGEFARRSGLSISALRFYGDCGLLVASRINSWTGYRQYSIGQLRDAALVRQLRALEMPIAEIRSLLTADPTAAEAALDHHQARLERRLECSRTALAAAQMLLRSKEQTMPATTTLDGSELARSLRQVLPAAGLMGKDLDYPAAVLVSLREDGVRLVATDGHRLAVRDLAAPTNDLQQTVLSVADAERMAEIAEGAGPVGLTADRDLEVLARGGTVHFAAIQDRYPDYEAVLGRCGAGRLLVAAADLAVRLDRTRDLVVLKLTKEATSADDVEFPSEYQGDELTIGFNPAYLADALDAGIGPEAVLQLGSPVDPVAIRSADGGTLTFMVMPIRLLQPGE